MDQNQTTDNDDLQKAIEDIAGATKNDPVFSDPVAAPSTIPEGDTGELGEPIGPFPNTMPDLPPISPEPANTLSPTDLSGLGTPPLAPAPIPPTDFSAPELQTPTADASVLEPSAELSTPEPPTPDLSTSGTIEALPASPSPTTSTSSVSQIKVAALRALIPIIDKLNLGPSQKFNLCRNILEELKDTSVLEPAYQAALDIADESERAEALLYLVESIDKM